MQSREGCAVGSDPHEIAHAHLAQGNAEGGYQDHSAVASRDPQGDLRNQRFFPTQSRHEAACGRQPHASDPLRNADLTRAQQRRKRRRWRRRKGPFG